MTTVQHKDIPNAQLHEPKGVNSASVDTGYVADGSGSGTWKAVPYKYALTVRLADLSTASSAYVVVPQAGKVEKIYTVIENAITTADGGLTFRINNTLITSSAITVTQSGSAAGDVDSSTPSALNTVVAGDVLKVTTDGAADTTCVTTVTYLIKVGYT
jgi:hypothetical protein